MIEFGQNAREVIPLFHEYNIWLPFNVMGNVLRQQANLTCLASWLCLYTLKSSHCVFFDIY